jgi:hypothetical protein
MIVPTDWLVCPTTAQEVEERLEAEGAADLWLKQWRDLLSQVGPDDELWEFFAVEQADPRLDSDFSDWREGIALVRDGVVIDSISTHYL